MRTRIAALIFAAAALGGCAYNGLGLGVGYGNGYYDPYYGYGYSPYGYSQYGSSPFGYGLGYGYGYGSPYGGWYDGFYYPGSGVWVYDRDRNRREMTDAERRYWRQRVASALANRVRDNGQTVTTNSTRVLRQQSVRSTTDSTSSVSRSEGRERFRDALRSRIEQRRAERAASKRDD